MIRDYEPQDLGRVKVLHALCGFDYELPDLARPSFAVRKILADGERLQAAAFLRTTSEAYLLMDGTWRTPAWRWEALKRLHEEVRAAAKKEELEDVHCWLPPDIEKRFGKRLLQLGWQPSKWSTYVTFVNP